MLSGQIQIVIQFRRGSTSSRVTSWRTGRQIAVRVAEHLVSGGRAQGHTEECRVRVEGELRKTEEGKARLRAAASRVGDAPTGRALKRVRFAADRVEDDARDARGYVSVSTITSPLLKMRRPILCQRIHPRPRNPRLQLKCLMK